MTDTITIDRAEYDRLRAATDMLEDIQAYDVAMESYSEADMMPDEFVGRLLDGESPVAVFREWRGLSVMALANDSGVNRVQIHDIESGRKTGSVATMKKLAEALSTTLDDLVGS